MSNTLPRAAGPSSADPLRRDPRTGSVGGGGTSGGDAVIPASVRRFVVQRLQPVGESARRWRSGRRIRAVVADPAAWTRVTALPGQDAGPVVLASLGPGGPRVVLRAASSPGAVAASGRPGAQTTVTQSGPGGDGAPAKRPRPVVLGTDRSDPRRVVMVDLALAPGPVRVAGDPEAVRRLLATLAAQLAAQAPPAARTVHLLGDLLPGLAARGIEDAVADVRAAPVTGEAVPVLVGPAPGGGTGTQAEARAGVQDPAQALAGLLGERRDVLVVTTVDMDGPSWRFDVTSGAVLSCPELGLECDCSALPAAVAAALPAAVAALAGAAPVVAAPDSGPVDADGADGPPASGSPATRAAVVAALPRGRQAGDPLWDADTLEEPGGGAADTTRLPDPPAPVPLLDVLPQVPAERRPVGVALLGLAGDPPEPVLLRPGGTAPFVVLGPGGSGRTGALATMAVSLLASGTWVLALVTAASPLSRLAGHPRAIVRSAADEDVLRAVREAIEMTSGPVVVLVDDADRPGIPVADLAALHAGRVAMVLAGTVEGVGAVLPGPNGEGETPTGALLAPWSRAGLDLLRLPDPGTAPDGPGVCLYRPDDAEPVLVRIPHAVLR